MNIPQDPVILLSYINTKLRNEYKTISELCTALELDQTNLIIKLEATGYTYDRSINQFISKD